MDKSQLTIRSSSEQRSNTPKQYQSTPKHLGLTSKKIQNWDINQRDTTDLWRGKSKKFLSSYWSKTIKQQWMSNRTLHQRQKRSNNEWQCGMQKKPTPRNLNAQVTLTSGKKMQKTETNNVRKPKPENTTWICILNAPCGSRPATEAKNGKMENRGVVLIWLILYFSGCYAIYLNFSWLKIVKR